MSHTSCLPAIKGWRDLLKSMINVFTTLKTYTFVYIYGMEQIMKGNMT